jgi:hypothetical protein
VTTSHDPTNQPATSPQPAGASHRAEAAARRANEHVQAARTVDCECQAKAGAPCGPAGDHLARYLSAYQSGALTRDSVAQVIAELDVIAPRALIQPPSERATPTGAAQVVRGQASAGMTAARTRGPAHRALAPEGEALGRSPGAALAACAREEHEREAGS